METTSDRDELQERLTKRAFNKRICTFVIVNKDHIDIKAFLSDAFRIYRTEVNRILEKHNVVETSTVFACRFENFFLNLNNQLNSSASESSNSSNNSKEQTVKQTYYTITTSIIIGLDVGWDKHYQTKNCRWND